MLSADGAPWSSCRWFHENRLQLTSLRHEQQNLFPIVRTGMGSLILGKLVFWQWHPFCTKTKTNGWKGTVPKAISVLCVLLSLPQVLQTLESFLCSALSSHWSPRQTTWWMRFATKLKEGFLFGRFCHNCFTSFNLLRIQPYLGTLYDNQ